MGLGLRLHGGFLVFEFVRDWIVVLLPSSGPLIPFLLSKFIDYIYIFVSYQINNNYKKKTNITTAIFWYKTLCVDCRVHSVTSGYMDLRVVHHCSYIPDITFALIFLSNVDDIIRFLMLRVVNQQPWEELSFWPSFLELNSSVLL